MCYHEKGDSETLLKEQCRRSKAREMDLHSVVANPQFVNYVHGDFSFMPDSPALGIEQLPLKTWNKWERQEIGF
jgi:hypothetical protein